MPNCRVDPSVMHAGLRPVMYINKGSAKFLEKEVEEYWKYASRLERFLIVLAGILLLVASLLVATFGSYYWYWDNESRTTMVPTVDPTPIKER